jgi:hypothetical protein
LIFLISGLRHTNQKRQGAWRKIPQTQMTNKVDCGLILNNSGALLQFYRAEGVSLHIDRLIRILRLEFKNSSAIALARPIAIERTAFTLA